MQYSIEKIKEILGGEFIKHDFPDAVIETVATDSRTLLDTKGSLFFALRTKKQNGIKYIADCLQKGVSNFIVEEPLKENLNGKANVILVPNAVNALQNLASFHRTQYKIPIVGITGSNGKTIVKEWLKSLLSVDRNVVSSPKSYNSQIGVPLSVLQMEKHHEVGIFEAGISMPVEMGNLQKIIQPRLGILTNIGEAHQSNFSSPEEKCLEKLELFKNSETLIYCSDQSLVNNTISEWLKENPVKVFSWGHHEDATIKVENAEASNSQTVLRIRYNHQSYDFTIPFTDKTSIENVMHCVCAMFYFGYSIKEIQERVLGLHHIAMRLEMKEALNGCTLINDSYNSDLGSLGIALDALNQLTHYKTKTLILSDIYESGLEEAVLYKKVAEISIAKGIKKFIGIGENLSSHQNLFSQIECTFYNNTPSFLADYPMSRFRDEAILIKGSRVFTFEHIAERLQQKAHDTVLEINLSAVLHNYHTYKSLLKPETKIMAMVKAFSYGSGGYEIASVLQYHKIDYLAVAYADEGVLLREKGITIPIMVMNPELSGIGLLKRHQLEPEMYSLKQLKTYLNRSSVDNEPLAIHLKLDTGMHRLGFEEHDLDELITLLTNEKSLHVISIFSHLSGSDSSLHDDFTNAQITLFNRMSTRIERALGYPTIKHILNSSGIVRFPQAHFDMVRLGIGLYGIDPTEELHQKLETVTTLKTTISQIKQIKKGEHIGYSRTGVAQKDSIIATIAIGYADGFPRLLGNGKGVVYINRQQAPTIGNICMDMCMIDITGIPAEEGDEVIIFSREHPVELLAQSMQTIPYEVLTNISQRVKRVYFRE